MSKVYQILTDKVLDLINKGVVPWRRPWKPGNMPRNYQGRPYNGCNMFLLSILKEFEGWNTGIFLTFKQIQALGGKIKEGQEKRHSPVFFWNWNAKGKDSVTGDEITFPVFRFFLVWNFDQVEGIELPKWARENRPPVNSLEICDAIVAGYKDGPEIRHGGDRACYSPVSDLVKMPERNSFTNSEGYYATLFHELGHSTGHAKRLNRKGITDPIRYGSHEYSQEELVAELTATFLCSEAGIENVVLDNAASYLAGWWSALKKEPKMFAMASAQAMKAAKRILGEDAKEENEEAQEAA